MTADEWSRARDASRAAAAPASPAAEVDLRAAFESFYTAVNAYMLLVSGIRAGPLSSGEHALVLHDLIAASKVAGAALAVHRGGA